MKIRSMMIGLGLALAAPAASAVTLNSAGSICQPVFPEYADTTYYLDGAVGTFSSSEVECAVPRATGGIQMTVSFDLLHTGTQTTICTIVVYDRDGSPLTAMNVSKTGSGWQRGSATFSAAQNPSWGYTSVYCPLANPSVRLIGVVAAY